MAIQAPAPTFRLHLLRLQTYSEGCAELRLLAALVEEPDPTTLVGWRQALIRAGASPMALLVCSRAWRRWRFQVCRARTTNL